MYFDDQTDRERRTITPTPGAFPQLTQAAARADPNRENPDAPGGGGDTSPPEEPTPPGGGTPAEPPSTPGTPGGGGTNPSTGGGTGGGPGTPGPRPGTPGRTGQTSPGPRNLGLPSGPVGSWRNLQNLLQANAGKEASYAEQFSKSMESKAKAATQAPGAIPKADEYNRLTTPGATVGDKPTAPTAGQLPQDPGTAPKYLDPYGHNDPVNVNIRRQWEAARKAYDDAVAANKAAQDKYAADLAAWEAAQTEAGKPVAHQDSAKQQEGRDVGYSLGQGATPGGYSNWLASRGVGGAGARRLDAYLYGGAPGGAQGDIRGLQQQYGGLLGLVANFVPYGSTYKDDRWIAPAAATAEDTGKPPRQSGGGVVSDTPVSTVPLPGPTTAPAPTPAPTRGDTTNAPPVPTYDPNTYRPAPPRTAGGTVDTTPVSTAPPLPAPPPATTSRTPGVAAPNATGYTAPAATEPRLPTNLQRKLDYTMLRDLIGV